MSTGGTPSALATGLRPAGGPLLWGVFRPPIEVGEVEAA